MMVLKNIHKSYGTHNVLHGVHAEFLPGMVYGIVGKNGAGKSTLFRCIAQLEHHLGEIIYASGSLKRHVGLLETYPMFMSYMTGYEYLNLMLLACGRHITANHDMNLFELPLNQYASKYSTGMKKKLALTGILLQQKNIFLFDEPFNGVDWQSNIILQELIRQLKSKNKIVILSSHIFTTLQQTCDEIIILENGVFSDTYRKNEFDQLATTFHQDLTAHWQERLNFITEL